MNGPCNNLKSQNPLSLSLSKAARSLGLPMLLAACGSPETRAAAEGEEAIECALAGSATFARTCAVERATLDGTLTLVVHHPDGGFRRFEVLKDGGGVATADGAAVAQLSLAGGLLEVTVDGDRYRFPVTAKSSAPAQ
ncbi:MAG TPA: hypothetical protein VHG29_11090 [Novosphingobium sp.]|nr:hypothetical protein [Novosphingobium sp.]